MGTYGSFSIVYRGKTIRGYVSMDGYPSGFLGSVALIIRRLGADFNAGSFLIELLTGIDNVYVSDDLDGLYTYVIDFDNDVVRAEYDDITVRVPLGEFLSPARGERKFRGHSVRGMAWQFSKIV